ncbi:GntR family transcriptional regulator [Streptomyces lasiicapitis]|uniref:GntR family transcriptional regulator n=1 Tax=Streptomyces lasiicapitis TaxID=1923961 RepID=A0ABQ2LLM5_9ACTN|nr:GntR family transcriptional regulator [Streptomyces lasiicapitis]GGO39445.1 GntR family transcriptional regulator [Streptomyces lasiicapitis]
MERARARAADVPAQCAAARVPEQPGARHADRPARGEHTHAEPDDTCPAPDELTLGESTLLAPERAVPAPVEGAAPAPAEQGIPAPRRTVQRTSVRGQILDALRAALVGGELTPGEVYSAPALGDRFGVSATPVREAMQQLALEGAVEVVPNRGFRVTRRSARELGELAEVRALIEVPVMLRLARTVPAERWARLRPLAEATVTAAARADLARYAEADRAFHGALLALSDNRQLVQIADDLHRRSQWPLETGPVTGRRADLVADAAEHTALLEALIARDLPVVQSLVREHFAGGDA